MSLWMKGNRADGKPVGGGLSAKTDVVAFTEQAFKGGWKSLEVRDSRTREQVAGINPHPDTDELTWWAKGEA